MTPDPFSRLSTLFLAFCRRRPEMEHKGEYGAHGGKMHYKPGEVEDVPQPLTPKCS